MSKNTTDSKSTGTERRSFSRIPVDLAAVIVVGDEHYPGTIENISANGICIRTVLPKSSILLLPKTPVHVRFETGPMDKINLYCEVIWLHLDKAAEKGFPGRAGMQIIEAPPEYKTFLEGLRSELRSKEK